VLSTRLSQVFLGTQEMSFLEAIYENAMSILGMILITSAVVIILNIAKKSEKEKLILSELNEKQTHINGQLKKSMSYMLSVYQAVHSIANERNEDKILNQILDNTAKTVEAEEVFYFKSCKENNEIIIKNIKVNTKNKRIEQTIKDYLLNFREIVNNAKEKTYLDVGEEYKIILMPITSNNYNFGFIGVLVKNFEDSNYSEITDLLKFMAQITEISLEKIQLEKINNKLIINEEQNRIASEIHDSVTQRLFAASCSMRAIMDNKALKEKEGVMSELGVVRTSLTKAIKELRETIYSMSWEKKSANAFYYELKEVIDEFANMYGIPISFNYNFKSNVTDYVLVKSIFRIVYETTSNALRHSNCSKIRINVFEKDDYINILISDNGVGINTNNTVNSEKSGFGLRNINTIVKKHNGRMRIDSRKEKGTVIKIVLPFHSYKGAEAV
jgi:signal transduction histidine kinase